MLYDIRATPRQIAALAAWIDPSDGMADVELRMDADVLIAQQGESRVAFNPDVDPGDFARESFVLDGDAVLRVAPAMCEHDDYPTTYRAIELARETIYPHSIAFVQKES